MEYATTWAALDLIGTASTILVISKVATKTFEVIKNF